MAAPAGPRRLLTNPAVAGLALLLLYLGLSMMMDDHGYLGTDTGGKVATLDAMVDSGSLDPDVGYWAEQWDPEGTFHPLYYTSHVGDRWVNVTTLPMLVAAYPLYRAGGYEAALLLPMLGALATAFAARAMARRCGRNEWLAFWVVALASPIALYALDLWEHAPGVALMSWGVVVAFDAAFDDASWWRGLAAGVLFGAAATMRTEALVYGLGTLGVTCLVVWLMRQQFARAVLLGLAAVVGLAVPLVLNALLEVATMGSSFRSGRATSAAGAGATDLGQRVQEAALTSVGLEPALETGSYVVGAGLLLLLVYLARKGDAETGRRRQPALVLVAAGIGVLYLARFSEGPGFVPGLVAATPWAAVGLALGWDDARRRFLTGVALVPLPLVWLYQFSGGAGPQWGGRYMLPTAVVLAAVGLSQADRLLGWVRTGLVVLSVAVTAFGFAWLVQRSHGIADSAEAFANRPEPVLVSTIAHQDREYGAYYDQRPWLTAPFSEDRAEVLAVVEDAGFDEFGYVSLPGKPPTFEGWSAVGSDTVEFVPGVDFEVTTYRRDQ